MTIYKDTVQMYLVGLILNIPSRSLAFSTTISLTDFSGTWLDLWNSFPSRYVATIATSRTVWLQVSLIWKERGFSTVALYFCNVLSLSPLICKSLDCCTVAALVCPFFFFPGPVRNREIGIMRSQTTGVKKIALLLEDKVLAFSGT